MDTSTHNDFAERVSLMTRVAEVIFAGRYDRELVAGAAPELGSPLALHIARLTSIHEREQLARALQEVVHDVHTAIPDRPEPTARVPLDRASIVAAEVRINEVVIRLHAPRPISAHGVARLRLLLSDGAGPVYRFGRGDLTAELAAVLATL